MESGSWNGDYAKMVAMCGACNTPSESLSLSVILSPYQKNLLTEISQEAFNPETYWMETNYYYNYYHVNSLKPPMAMNHNC
jgi:hypothetical protein